MKVVDVMEKINLYQIPVELQKISIEQINHGLILAFVVADEAEIEYYKSLKNEEKKKYVSTSPKIILSDITVKQYVELFKEDVGDAYTDTINSIKEITDIDNIDEEITLCIYTLLHEIGHWHHFAELGNNIYDFAMLDDVVRREVFEENKEIKRKLQTNKNKITNSIKRQLKRNTIKYREIPMEARADQYAYDNLEKALLMYTNG